MSAWTLRFDGLYEPRYRKDGIATYGFVVERDAEVVHEGHGVVVPPGMGSANVAEFGALLHGLSWLRDHGVDGDALRVLGDSRLVIETVAGRWDLSSERLRPLRDMARAIAQELDVPVTYEKVSREENARADALTREAYREALREHPEWRTPSQR